MNSQTDLYIDLIFKIALFAFILYGISNRLKGYDSNRKMKYVLIIILFTGIAHILNKWLNIDDWKHGKEISNIHLMTITVTFIFLITIFFYLLKMV